MNHRLRVYLLTVLSILILSWEAHVVMPAQASHVSHEEEQVIPEQSIRLRIKANSNSAIDQSVKRNIRDAVNSQITLWVDDIEDVEMAREVINNNKEALNSIVAKELEKAGSKEGFEVSLQKTNFPTKLYGNRLYPAGEYEAVLITIGDGLGDNWWCVLFPPLCFLDFSNGDAVDHDHGEEAEQDGEETKEEEEVEVSFFVVEIITNIWNRITA